LKVAGWIFVGGRQLSEISTVVVI